MKQNQEQKLTFATFDKLKLRSFAENLLQIMEKGSNSAITDRGYKGGYTVSLNAEFGNGKTTFLKMFEHFINTEQKDKYDVLFVNAWESDFCEEPVIAILSEFINWIKQQDQNSDKSHIKEEDISKTKQAIGMLGNKAIGVLGYIANQVIQNKTGIDIREVKNSYIKNTASDKLLTSLGNNILKNFNTRKDAIENVRSIFSQYLNSQQNLNSQQRKLLIIVDELDRTRPDYAVRFMEDMKHFFDIENVVFLVAVNRVQMEATVKCLYGPGLNFDGYYGKFFKHEIDLPDPYKEAQKWIDDLITKTKIKYHTGHPRMRDMGVNNTYLSCKMFNLTLREVEQFIRILSMILEHDQTPAPWVYLDCYSFFICLFIKQKEVFNKIPSGNFTVFQFVDFLNQICPELKTPVLKYTELNYLLATVACSFLVFSHKSDQHTLTESEIKCIQKLDPNIETQTLYSICSEEGFGPMLQQPVLDICKKIRDCESHFSK